MANTFIAFPNRGDQATLAGGSFALPLTELQNRIIKRPARTTGTADGNFVVDGVFSEPRAMRVFSLVRHNFSIEATYRVRIYSDVGQSVLEYDSGILPVFDVVYTEETETWDSGNLWDLTLSAEERDGLTASLIHVLPTLYTEVSFRVEVFDSSNIDGYLEAGRLFVGSGYQPVYNMAYGVNVGFESRSITDETIGGNEFHDERESPRVVNFSLPHASEDEAFGMGFELQRKQGTTKDVFFIYDPDDKLNLLRRSFLARMRSLSPIEHDFFNNHSQQFQLKEQI